MSVLDVARQLFSSGKQQEAVKHVRSAADGGDAEAAAAFAHWLLFGIYVPRDLDKAADYLAIAATTDPESARIELYLRGNGTFPGFSRAKVEAAMAELAKNDEIAEAQIRLLRQGMEEQPEWSVETVSRDPGIRLIRGLLTADECDYLKALAGPLFAPSMIVDPRTGARRADPIRTSHSTSFSPVQEDLVVHMVNRRIADASGTLVDAGEPLHMLRYAPGQQYKPHFDVITGLKNQRSHTAILYLNDDYEGGETAFDQLEIKVKGRRGDALLFTNLREDGRPDQRMRHAGLPVTKGMKFIATRWIRQSPFHVWRGEG